MEDAHVSLVVGIFFLDPGEEVVGVVVGLVEDAGHFPICVVAGVVLRVAVSEVLDVLVRCLVDVLEVDDEVRGGGEKS